MKTIALISYNLSDFENWIKEHVTIDPIFHCLGEYKSYRTHYSQDNDYHVYVCVSTPYIAERIGYRYTIDYIDFTQRAAEGLTDFGEIIRLTKLNIKKKFYFGR